VLDGHSFHETQAILQLAIEENIHIPSLPPHTTHCLQPLDRSVFGPFNKSYNTTCSDFLSQHPLHLVNKWTFPALFKTAWEASLTPQNIQSADKNLGICINSTSWYISEYERQLSDPLVYQPIPFESKDDLISQGLDFLQGIHSKYSSSCFFESLDVSQSQLDTLISRKASDVVIPSLNILPKPHKLSQPPSPSNEPSLKGRPIVNGFATLNTEPSRLLGSLLKGYLKDITVKASLQGITSPIVYSSLEEVSLLEEIAIPPDDLINMFFISYDFTSLYTSITSEHMMETIHFVGEFLDLNHSTVQFMIELCSYIRGHAYFHVGQNSCTFKRKVLLWVCTILAIRPILLF
jgi:hypothetical protein